MLNPDSKEGSIGELEMPRAQRQMFHRSSGNGPARAGEREYRKTVLLFTKMLVTVFACEAVVMALLQTLRLKNEWNIVVDPVLLTILSTPLLYWLLVRPIWHLLRQRTRAMEDLSKYRERLEERVRARTTELTQTNKQLREEIERRKGLERELLSVVEQERQRIGQELHDSIGQQLTGIAFMMEVLGEKLAGKSLTEEVPYAEKINARVSRAVDLARDLAKGLHPIDLDRNGLVAVLHELAADTEQLFNVSCTFASDKSVSVRRISAPINLYRIAQEAITNAVRHGKARNIRLRLSSENGNIVLSIENDGLAFPAEPGRVEGMGLKIMRYRAELMNSSLAIRKGAHGGAVVTCVLPKEEDLQI